MSGILESISGIAGLLKAKGMGVLDSLFPPEKRAEVWSKLQNFAINNPKLSAFLLTQFALSGLPLVMFVAFTVTVFVFSLVAALLVGLLVALLFTVFMVFVALLVVLPTVFLTTLGATFLFLWGLGGYYILKWFNEGEMPAPEGKAIGDKLNSLSGGRLGFLIDGARKHEADNSDSGKENIKQNGRRQKKSNPEKLQKRQDLNGNLSDAAKNLDVSDTADQATKATGVDKVQKKADGTTGKLNNTAGLAKGAVGGATGLA